MRQYLSLAVFSASSLALEVTLTRLLSTLYYPPFIFVVLSLAVLGIALGAAWVVIEPYLRDEQRIPLWMMASSVGVLVQVIGLPYAATLDTPIITGLLLTLPYVGIGVTLAALFSVLSEHSQALYAYDLIGAGVGAVLVIALLNALNPLNAMLALALVMVLASLLYRIQTFALVALPVTLIMLVGNVALGIISVDLSALSTEKPIQQVLREGGEIIETRFDSFARTDLVALGNQPWRIYVDGAAASVVPPAASNSFLLQDIGLFAFATAQPQTVFIIGSGGGLDVWLAQQVGAEQITAVEVNPQSVALVRDLEDYSGTLYDSGGVRVLIDEGRSVLQRDDARYDMIYLSQVVTLTAERSGYALTENAVFTVEAFAQYWEHLSDEGYLALKLYDEQTLSRSLALIINLLNQQGMSDQEALRHTITLLSPETSPPTPMLIIRKTPFTAEEAVSIGSAAQRIGFAPLYLPHVQADPPLDEIEAGTATFADIIAGADLDLSAPTDNRPFFYQFERGIPRSMTPLLIASGGVLIALMMGLGVFYWRERPPQLLPMSVYFAGLGAGFMLIELVLIQTTRLFIGHPTLAVTSSLALLLIGGGLGSAWYYQRQPDPQRLPLWVVLALIALALLWQVIWQPLSALFVSSGVSVRLLLVALTILPLAFLMGIPFAVGLRIAGTHHPHSVAIAWMLNGIFTVIGTVLGVVLALVSGYISVLIAGTVCYGLVLIVSRFYRMIG
ncbi:MAG: hypothetical protein ACFE0Q_13915 [Anaerolineae bacterium]